MSDGKLSKEARDDPFRPPDPPRIVRCLHCDESYLSSMMRWADGFWYCGTPDCSGKGYGIDIFDEDEGIFADDEGDEYEFDEDDF
jgi:hypothetical protein